jgi:hypothetical protein
VTIQQGGDHLSWVDPDATILRYEVERKESTGWIDLTPVAGFDTPLPFGRTDYTVSVPLAFLLEGVRTYHVCAVNVTGRTCSSEVATPSVSRQVSVHASPPTVVKVARNSAGGVDVTWTAADSLSDTFQVERMDNGSWTDLGSVGSQAALTFTDHPQPLLTSHSYRVCAEGLFGEACSPATALPSLINVNQSSFGH